MDATTREAKQESVVTPESLPKDLYCILHEGMVEVHNTPFGIGHFATDKDGELDMCFFEGGYAFVPPPAEIAEPSDDWASQPDCLSDDERATAEVEEMGIWGILE